MPLGPLCHGVVAWYVVFPDFQNPLFVLKTFPMSFGCLFLSSLSWEMLQEYLVLKFWGVMLAHMMAALSSAFLILTFLVDSDFFPASFSVILMQKTFFQLKLRIAQNIFLPFLSN